MEEPILEYTSTISKLREEISTLRTTLTQKNKDEERMKDQIKALEEKETQITSYLTVLFRTKHLRTIRRGVRMPLRST